MVQPISNDAMISLTPEAIEQIKILRKEDSEYAEKHLRLYVEGGCCSKMNYGMLFDSKQEGDTEITFGDFSVIIDPESISYLRGAEVNYVTSPEGSGFEINAPPPLRPCGCDCQ
jgi:iron-sulfur cluster assembly accessory protein